MTNMYFDVPTPPKLTLGDPQAGSSARDYTSSPHETRQRRYVHAPKAYVPIAPCRGAIEQASVTRTLWMIILRSIFLPLFTICIHNQRISFFTAGRKTFLEDLPCLELMRYHDQLFTHFPDITAWHNGRRNIYHTIFVT